MPNATMCVPCLTTAGDVPVLRRFDETLPTGEVVETYFTSDPRIQRQINHRIMHVADGESFAVVVGDDAHLKTEANQIICAALPLPTAFEEETEVERKGHGRGVRQRRYPVLAAA